MLKIINETGGVFGTKVLAADGTDITAALAVEAIKVKIDTADPVVRAEMTVGLVQAEIVAGEAAWLTRHPISGDYQPVSRICFADGTVVEFKDGAPVVVPPCVRINTVDAPRTTKFRPPPLSGS